MGPPARGPHKHCASQLLGGGGGCCPAFVHSRRTAPTMLGRKMRRITRKSTSAPKKTPQEMASSEPLSWLPPGGSGRDHHPLCAALATEATASASSGLIAQPFRKRPTLTRGNPRGPTKGGRRLPAPRGLVLDGLLIRRLQGGLPPRPGLTRLAYVEQGRLWIHAACQIGREEVPLGTGPTGTGMPALGAGVLLHAATVAGLGESCPPGIDVHDRPASTSSQAGQALHKKPQRTQFNPFA